MRGRGGLGQRGVARGMSGGGGRLRAVFFGGPGAARRPRAPFPRPPRPRPPPSRRSPPSGQVFSSVGEARLGSGAGRGGLRVAGERGSRLT